MVSAQEFRPVLVAETDDVRPFARLLRGVGFHNRATVHVQQAGLQVLVDGGRTMSACSYVLAALFDQYKLTLPPPADPAADSDDDDGVRSFDVNLNTLLECLNIYGNATAPHPTRGLTHASLDGEPGGGGGGGGGGSGWRKKRWAGEEDEAHEGESRGGGGRDKELRTTGLIMTWRGPGWPLELVLKDEDPTSPTTVCSLILQEPEDPVLDEFDEENMALMIIMKSAWLREAISDLDPACSRLTIIARPEVRGQPAPGGYNPRTEREKAGMFRLEAVGNFGKTELDYPNDKEVMDCFKCTDEIKFSYNFSTFSLANRALQSSVKVSLRIDHDGFLSLQLMMPQPGNKKVAPTEAGIIDFKFRALEEEE